MCILFICSRIAARARGPSDSFVEWVVFRSGRVCFGGVRVAVSISLGCYVDWFFSWFTANGVVAALHVIQGCRFDVALGWVSTRCRCVVGIGS